MFWFGSKKRKKEKQEKLIQEYLKTEKEYKRRKYFCDDLSWMLRQFEIEGLTGVFTMADMLMWCETALEIEKEKDEKRKESSPGSGGLMPNDRITKIESCREYLVNLRDEVPPQKKTEANKWLEQRIEKESLSKREYLEDIIVQIQVNLEAMKRLLCRHSEPREKDYRAAGTILMPTYELLFQRTLKHEVLTNIQYKDEYMDEFDEFKNESDIVDLDFDTDWKDKDIVIKQVS